MKIIIEMSALARLAFVCLVVGFVVASCALSALGR